PSQRECRTPPAELWGGGNVFVVRFQEAPTRPVFIRVQLNGPNEFGFVEAPVTGSSSLIESFNHSSGDVLPCTTTRWKLSTPENCGCRPRFVVQATSPAGDSV